MSVEIKICEACGRLFLRQCHPQEWSESLSRWLEVPRTKFCVTCTIRPPEEIITHHKYVVEAKVMTQEPIHAMQTHQVLREFPESGNRRYR